MEEADRPYMLRPKVKYPIIAEKTAIIVVDMQNHFVKPGAPIGAPAALAMVPRLNGLLDLCRESKILVIYMTHILRADGSNAGRLADVNPRIRDRKVLQEGTEMAEIYHELRPKPGDVVVNKPRYSAFYGSDLESILRPKGIDTLIISGVATSGCCLATAQDAFSRDYKIIFLSDGNATVDLPDVGWGPVPAELAQRVTLAMVACLLGQVASIGEVSEEVRQASLSSVRA